MLKTKSLRFTTLIVLISSFTVVAGMLLLGQNLQKVLTLWGESFQMTVYLSENISENAFRNLETSLKNNSQIQKIEFVNQDQALNQFQQQMASYAPDLLADPDLLKLIPSSFQFSLSNEVAVEDQLQVMQQVAAELQVMSGVEEVSYGQNWVKSYAELTSVFKWTGLTFILVIMSAAVFVISNCLRSSIFQRKEEIEVLELVGATSHFIRKPFIIEGIALCFMGASLAIGATYFLFEVLQKSIQSQLSLLQISQHVQFFSLETILVFIAGSVFLGWVSAVFCLKSINDGWAASSKVNHE